jgi:twitching motility two-component system response regulator PilG
MVVDDSRMILRTAKRFLEVAGYEVVTAEDGFRALAEIVRVRPDVLFLDVMMPRLNGYDACLAIKSSPEFVDLPVVMLSSKDSPFDKAKGALMGCSDYLTKPFASETLLDAVRRHLPSVE